jgi:type IV secretion system protein VirB1
MSTLFGMLLPALLAQCGPAVSPDTLEAVMQVESGRHGWAINDNSTGRAYFPSSAATARELARQLLRQGHALAIGGMQVHSRWLDRLGLTPDQLLDPCVNIHVASLILQDDYRTCGRKGYRESARLDCTLTAYWSGQFNPDSTYARKVRANGKKRPPAPTPAPQDVFADDRIFGAERSR